MLPADNSHNPQFVTPDFFLQFPHQRQIAQVGGIAHGMHQHNMTEPLQILAILQNG